MIGAGLYGRKKNVKKKTEMSIIFITFQHFWFWQIIIKKAWRAIAFCYRLLRQFFAFFYSCRNITKLVGVEDSLRAWYWFLLVFFSRLLFISLPETSLIEAKAYSKFNSILCKYHRGLGALIRFGAPKYGILYTVKVGHNAILKG